MGSLMKSEYDRRWTKQDRQKVSSSKSQLAYQRFKQAKEELLKSNEVQRKKENTK
jgi:hypothetical protein